MTDYQKFLAGLAQGKSDADQCAQYLASFQLPPSATDQQKADYAKMLSDCQGAASLLADAQAIAAKYPA